MPRLCGPSTELSAIWLASSHFSQQQARLRRNILSINTDESWNDTLAEMQAHCGAIVYFRRRGCPACNHIGPKFYEISRELELGGCDMLFVEVDVQLCAAATNNFGVHGAPSFRIFQHGASCEGFSGVSTAVLREHAERLRRKTTVCPRCDGGGFETLGSLTRILEHVVRYGRLPGGDPLELDGGTRIPTGTRKLPFDSHLGLDSAERRLELLEERLFRPPCGSRLSAHDELVSSFLQNTSDEGLDVADPRRAVQEWLTTRLADCPVWSAETVSSISTLTDAALSRRATRVEYWLLHSLANVPGRPQVVQQASAGLVASLQKQLSVLWAAARPCKSDCGRCALPCSFARCHGGVHHCGSRDHLCHKPVPWGTLFSQGSDASNTRTLRFECLLAAGHTGPCGSRATRNLPPPICRAGETHTCAICLDILDILADNNDKRLEDTAVSEEGPLKKHLQLPLVKRAPSQNLGSHLGSAGSAQNEQITNEHGEDGRCILLPCGHAFHWACAELWLEKHGSCPLCRSSTRDLTPSSTTADSPTSSPVSSFSPASLYRGSTARRRATSRGLTPLAGSRSPTHPSSPVSLMASSSNNRETTAAAAAAAGGAALESEHGRWTLLSQGAHVWGATC